MSQATASTTPIAVFDPGAEPHDPDLYRPGEVIIPLASPRQVSADAIRSYEDDGFIAVEQVYNATEIRTAMAALDDLIDRKVDGHPANMIFFEAGARRDVDTMDIEERRGAVRKVFRFCPHEARLTALSQHPNIISIVERMLGGPCKMIQDMALLKPPQVGREKPWHQDHAYFDYPLDEPIVGVWIALDEATLENGCMCAMRGWQQRGPLPPPWPPRTKRPIVTSRRRGPRRRSPSRRRRPDWCGETTTPFQSPSPRSAFRAPAPRVARPHSRPAPAIPDAPHATSAPRLPPNCA